MKSKKSRNRVEKDSMGEFKVPASAYYGAQTMRAVENFPISSLRFSRAFIRALGQIKLAAAQANGNLGLLENKMVDVIVKAAQEVIDGSLDDHFVIDVFQTGSGTSTNMNANEVISNRAIEILGGKLGSRTPVHPNDHVNLGQSSNDVIPTAIHVAGIKLIYNDLIPSLLHLKEEIDKKSREFMSVVKTGRTHLQDATPIRLGQEFIGYSGQIERGIEHMHYSAKSLSELAIGGTAVGTGVNTHPEFAKTVCINLSKMIEYPVRETDNHFQAQSSIDTVVHCSGVLKTVAISLMKIANDIRWLGSGPRAGIGEIELPAVQPGSSIMPGKTNPVIPESVCQVAAHVIGNDVTISVAGQSGNFEINTMMPVAAYNLLESIDILATAARNLADQCISGLIATKKGTELVQNGLSIVTTLVPHIGYDAAAAIAKEAQITGKSIREVAKTRTSFSASSLDKILDPEAMTKTGIDR